MHHLFNKAFYTNLILVCLCLIIVNPAIAKNSSNSSQLPRSPSHSTVVTILLYPVNRVLDVFDIFRANIGFGPGYGINVRATKALQLGLENYDTVRIGLGKESGIWNPRYGILYTEAEPFTAGASLAYMGGRQRGLWEFGTTIHLVHVGTEAAIDLSEIADLLLGFIMIDFKEDDY